MPVGFENSLKMSFSLSSLQSGGGQGSPQQVMMQVERPYNSLTKKRVNLEREMWRRSWGTQEEKKDEFWAALQPNYNYLMDNNLIESCKEAHGELSCDEEETALLSKWSFKDFTAQFSELRSWLNDIGEAIYGKEENIRNRNLRLEHVETMQRNAYKRKLFNEQAKRLLMEHSELTDEVTWRVKYLNRKWDMMEQSISPSKAQSKESFCADVEHEAECLKEWIREMEHRLKPLNMQTVNNWNSQECVDKISECLVLQQDIRAHGKVVAAVVKSANLPEATASLQFAKRLERRYHLLYLRSVEWQCYLERALKYCKHPHPDHLCLESDEEPLSKHPRLSSADCSDRLTDDSYFEDDIQDYCVNDANLQSSAKSSSLLRRNSSVCEHCKDLDVSPDILINQKCEQKNTRNKNEVENCSEADIATPSASGHLVEVENTAFSPAENDSNSFNKSDRKAHNLATYYFKHCETDSEQMQCRENIEKELTNSKICEVKMCEESSDEEWTYTSANRTIIEKEKGNVPASGNLYQTIPKRNVAVRLNFDENADQSSGNEANDKIQCGNSTENLNCSEMDTWNRTFTLPRSTEDTKESIQWLVRQAELLVREDLLMCSKERLDPSAQIPEITNSQARHARIKHWVRMHSALHDKVPDSCDASGEYTSGDSDEECSVESREESVGNSLVSKHLDALLNTDSQLDSVDGFSDPNVTLKADTSPDFADAKESGKVVTRSGQRCKRERPWSVSGISQLSSHKRKDEESCFANFSASESALNQIFTTNSTIRDRQSSVVSSYGFQDNLSSSTVNENTKLVSEHGGSLPRRRARQRKKTQQSSYIKNDPNDATKLACTSATSSPKFKNVDRSDSICSATLTDDKERRLSETTCTSATSEQNTVSDSSIFPTESSCCRVNGDDKTIGSEDELFSGKTTGFPDFRLGPKEGAVTPKADIIPNSAMQSGADSDVERTCGPQGADEQLSSSEQAWDSYQDKYSSEPYSEERADSETARRLLEFGDDYHNFLDSQSDCASSFEISQRTSPQRKRKSIVGGGDSSVLDSDSDLEDIHHVIQQSQSHFVFTEQVLNKQLTKTSSDVWVTDYAEIIATCKENKRCLRVILENVKEGEILTLKERREIQELLGKWNDLQTYADELQKMSFLQQKLILLRRKLLDTTTKVSSLTENLNDLSHLESAIEMLKEESTCLLDFKEQLRHLNVAMHQIESDPVSQANTVSSVMPQLKNDMTDLYRIWSDSFESVTSQLAQFQRAVQTWHKVDKELADLQTSLQGDHSTLLNLGKSLDDGGTAVEDVAVSIRNMACKLSEVPDSSHRNIHSSSSSCQDVQDASIGTREGSLSDSGISDSGSEKELSERARRLAFLKQLAQHLQTELGTSDGLVAQINEQIEHLDRELHQLQDVCQRLIARTTFWAGMPQRELTPISKPEVTRSIKSSTSELEACGKNTECSKPHRLRSAWSDSIPKNKARDKKISEQEKQTRWVWRIARAAVPVQLTLATLICVACFLQPHCCEGVNNLTLSPQLRYLYGPPPV